MPIYTVKKDNPKSTKTWEVSCSWKELQDILLEYRLVQVLSAPRIVESTGGVLSKTPDSWKEHLGRVKKGAGAGNTIKT
jgi:hypothetical protein|tara:strand:- start:206 stop:442 length:237 start_codon:yes stop_codon:yes gene_type:complete